VLVVDDDEDIRVILARFLEGAGYRVAQAPDGPSGIERFGLERPDLVLLDLQMPGMDGLEACRRLRALPGGTGIPVFMVTVRSQLATVSEALQAGATDYVLKPFDPDDVLARIAKVLGHGRDRHP